MRTPEVLPNGSAGSWILQPGTSLVTQNRAISRARLAEIAGTAPWSSLLAPKPPTTHMDRFTTALGGGKTTFAGRHHHQVHVCFFARADLFVFSEWHGMRRTADPCRVRSDPQLDGHQQISKPSNCHGNCWGVSLSPNTSSCQVYTKLGFKRELFNPNWVTFGKENMSKHQSST